MTLCLRARLSFGNRAISTIASLAVFCGSLMLGAQNTPQALYARGQHYGELSVQAFNELLKTAPESAYVLALLGEVKSKEHQYTAALYAYGEAAKRMPGLRGVHSGGAEIYRVQGKDAEASAEQAAEEKLGPPNCAIEKLQCDFSAGRFDDVVKTAKLKRNPENLYWLTRAYNELSLQSFAELGNLPESAELHQVKAQILRDQGQFRDSAEEWRSVLKLAPGDRNAQHELATSLYMMQDFKATLPELQQFLKAEPDSANLNFFVGDGMLQMEQVEQAIPFLETALKLDPKVLPAHASLGLCYGRLGKAQEAIPHLKAALELDKDGSLHYQLARAYQATGQPALAKGMMEKYQQLRKQAAP
jgi:tetratricopeptide (TPR) repeat protein